MKKLRRGFFVVIFSVLVFPCIASAKTIDVPFLSQVPPGEWSKTRNCGQTSYLMVDAYYGNKNVTSEAIRELDDWLFTVKGTSVRSYNGDYTTVNTLKDIAIEYAGVDPDEVVIVRGEEDVNLLREEIEFDRPVIVGVYTNMLLKGKKKDQLHFMVLIGIDEEFVYVNDPGKTLGKNNKYTIEQFLKAWKGNNYAAVLFRPQGHADQKTILEQTESAQSFWQKIKDTLFGWWKKSATEAQAPDELSIPSGDRPAAYNIKEAREDVSAESYNKEGNPVPESILSTELIFEKESQSESIQNNSIETFSIDPIIDTTPEVEEPVVEAPTNVIEKIVDTVVEDIKEVSHRTRKLFGNGGGSGSSVSTNDLPSGGVQKKVEVIPTSTFSVSFPRSTNFLTSTSTITFSGEIQGDAQIRMNGSYDNIASSGTNWVSSIFLEEGNNNIHIQAEDAQRGVFASSTYVVTRDSIAPTNVSLSWTRTTSSMGRLAWSAEDAGSGVAEYRIFYNINGEDWTNIIATSSNSVDIDIHQLDQLDIEAVAIDNAGNASVTLTLQKIVDWPKTIVINEIGWMGTRAGASNDEWIELYNNTDNTIDISGWKLEVSGEILPLLVQDSIIEGKSYAVLERSDEMSIVGVSSTALYTGSLNNTGEHVILRDSEGNIIDEVDSSGGWFAGDLYKSMARIDSNVSGSDRENWETTSFITPYAHPNGGGVLFGTPGRGNRGGWYLTNLDAQYFGTSTTLVLKKENSPYIFATGVTIPKNKVLHIEPGVVLAGENTDSYISVQGELHASGNLEEPIIFTSLHDQNYFHSDTQAQPGDWSHILVDQDGKSIISYTKFLYGGFPHTHKTGWVYGDTKQAQVISNTAGELYLDHVFIEKSFLQKNDLDFHSTVWIDGVSTTTIRESIFIGGYVAVKNNSSKRGVKIFDTSFSAYTNSNGPIVSKNHVPHLSHITYADNAFNGVHIFAPIITTTTVLHSEQPWIIGNITVAKDASLVINAGAKVYMTPQASISVAGKIAIGSQDGAITELAPWEEGTFWGSLILDEAEAVLQNVILKKGNYGLTKTQNNGMVIMQDSFLDMDTVVLLDARRPYNMFFAKDSEITIRNSHLGWSTPKAVKTWTIDGIKIIGGTLNIENTTFSGMDRGIEGYQGATGTMQNMDESWFTSTSLPWWPNTLFGELAGG